MFVFHDGKMTTQNLAGSVLDENMELGANTGKTERLALESRVCRFQLVPDVLPTQPP